MVLTFAKVIVQMRDATIKDKRAWLISCRALKFGMCLFSLVILPMDRSAELLRHEFGHFLQFKQNWAKFAFVIIPQSVVNFWVNVWRQHRGCYKLAFECESDASERGLHILSVCDAHDQSVIYHS